MADRDRTLVVAIAGIAATALVGLAGTAASWLSARDDRSAQRILARDDRTYERRVSVYLDAIDFVEGQRLAYATFSDETDLLVSGESAMRVRIHYVAPLRLTTLLRAFGSKQVFQAFQKAEALNRNIPFDMRVSRRNGWEEGPTGGSATDEWFEGVLNAPNSKQWISERTKVTQRYVVAYDAFRTQIERLERLVHDEVG